MKEDWNNLKKDIMFGYFSPDEQEGEESDND